MIVVDTAAPPADSDAASVKTLVSAPKFPRFFPTLSYISLPISIAAFICAILNGTHVLGHLNGLLTILAFACTLPYQVGAILHVWLHSHQTESILKFSPVSRGSVIYSTLLVIMWAASAVFTGVVMVALASGKGELEGVHVVAPVLAFSLSVIEAHAMGAITVLCHLHRRFHASAGSSLPMLELQPTRESSTKVISP